MVGKGSIEKNEDMINVIPLAGEGKRFKDENHTTPKPLILVSGKPMVIQAAHALPKAEKWIFVCRREHVIDYKLDETIRSYYPDAKIIVVDALTEGQASTCLLAKELINNDEELIIGACDNGMIWNKKKFEETKQDTDCLVWTYRNNTTVKKKPEAYGWVVVDENNNVKKTSVKIPISNTPMKDHAIAGAFWFKKGNIFVSAAEEMIEKNDKVNGEFYIDQCINYVVSAGLRVKIFEVEKYICWGTPEDLKKFQYWESFFKKYDESLNKNPV